MPNSKMRGFTVLELLIVVVFLGIVGTVFFIQKRDLEVSARDSARKTAINAIYYNLEDVFYPANKYYPQNLSSDLLKGLDPSQLTDPSGIMIGQTGSNYRYEAKDCKDQKCKSYTLSADLEYEADFPKLSRHQ